MANDKRARALELLREMQYPSGALPRGAYTTVGRQLEVRHGTVSRWWQADADNRTVAHREKVTYSPAQRDKALGWVAGEMAYLGDDATPPWGVWTRAGKTIGVAGDVVKRWWSEMSETERKERIRSASIARDSARGSAAHALHTGIAAATRHLEDPDTPAREVATLISALRGIADGDPAEEGDRVIHLYLNGARAPFPERVPAPPKLLPGDD